MKAAMGLLAVLAVVGGLVQVPWVDTALEKFLEPTFADSTLHLDPSDALTAFGLVLGTVLGARRHLHRLRDLGRAARARASASASASRCLYKLFVNKWYFDEIIDLVVVRPCAWLGRFGQQTFERVVINGLFVGGTTGIVKAGSAAARALQNGFLRAYAALLVLGIVAVAFYFLIQSS